MICITGHFERPKVKKALARATSFLKKNSLEFIAVNIKTKKFSSKKFCCILVIGGDGSLLRVCRELKFEIPVLGIGCGERNYLMKIKENEIEKKLGKLLSCSCKCEKRIRLQAFADGKKLPLALNEVLLVNKESGSIIKYCVKLNGKKISENCGDGVIVCSPTGSTGHAFSAGGKKFSKGIEVLEFNVMGAKPKPVVVSENAKIELSCLDKYFDYEVVIDGQMRFPVKKSIMVKKGKSINFLKV